MHALQNLGEQLVELSAAQLCKINIDNEALIEVVNQFSEYRTVAVDAGKCSSSANLCAVRMLSRLRRSMLTKTAGKAQERVIEGARMRRSRGDEALPEVLAIWPHGDRQLINSWLARTRRATTD